MRNFTIIELLTTAIVVFCFQNSHAGYGDPQDTLPSAFEREVLVMTNAVRMAPGAFRDTYIAGTSILSESAYPAVAPLLYNQDLSRGARFHSVDMAKNCGMVHKSCDGTPFEERVSTFYKGSSSIAENIAVGNPTGLLTVIQWLRDDDEQGVPAADRSGNDGHRESIMDTTYKEMGVGYAYNASRRGYHFWTQDFGGGKVTMVKVPAGCYYKPTSTTIAFAANYYDQSGSSPKSAEVIIDNTPKTMSVMLGVAAKGTWQYSMTDDKKVHCYYFVFTDGMGEWIRFPATATLTTGNALSCTTVSISNKGIALINRLSLPENAGPSSMFTLNGVKITGKLAVYRYASGIRYSENSGLINVKK
jgi:hypothetical protein